MADQQGPFAYYQRDRAEGSKHILPLLDLVQSRPYEPVEFIWYENNVTDPTAPSEPPICSPMQVRRRVVQEALTIFDPNVLRAFRIGGHGAPFHLAICAVTRSGVDAPVCTAPSPTDTSIARYGWGFSPPTACYEMPTATEVPVEWVAVDFPTMQDAVASFLAWVSAPTRREQS